MPILSATERNSKRQDEHKLSPFVDGTYITKYINISVYARIPIGTVIDYAGTTTPDGWLLCNGQSVAVASYSGLYDVIGYTFGGAGANFNIPDYNGYVVAGTTNTGLFNTSSGMVNFKEKEIEYGDGGIPQVIVDPEAADSNNLQPTKWLYKIIFAGPPGYAKQSAGSDFEDTPVYE